MTTKAKILLLSLLSFSFQKGNCSWSRLGNGFDWAVASLLADTATGILYAGGYFSTDSLKPLLGIAQWNGSQWDSVGAGTEGVNGVLELCKFQNKIYASGLFGHVGNKTTKGFAIWNGSNWDTLPCYPRYPAYCLKVIDNELYCASAFTNVCGQYTEFVAKYDGATWSEFTFGLDTNFQGGVLALEEYQGNLYVAGNIMPIEDIFMWDGTQAHQLGAGIQGGGSAINSMAVYKNELYVGGIIRKIDGNIGNYIMKWDGSQWSEVGGSVDNIVESMTVYDGYLYVCGGFSSAGGIPASRIARWDGSSWTALGTEIFDNRIYAMDFFNNQLYVGGGFYFIDTMSANFIVKYNGPVGVSDFAKPSFSFSFSPNPSNSFLTISFSSLLNEVGILSVADATGKKQFRVLIPRQTMRKELDVSELAAGVYFVTLQTEYGSITRKLQKQ